MKQSKSLGNYVNAQDEVSKYGADILRLWVSSVNYQEDIRCNDQIIGRMQDAYRKIRNTLRYLFGNTNDFDPERHAVPYAQMYPIDRWALQQLHKLIGEVRHAYDRFAFHRIFALIYNFCTVEMSNIYMDVLKDRMYCDARDSMSRRSAQTVMADILDALIRLLAPVLVHTCEEAWTALNHRSEPVDSVHFSSIPDADPAIDWQAEQTQWDRLMRLRDEVLKVLEGLRQDKHIASNQEACVTLECNPEDAAVLEWFGSDHFAALCIVSEIQVLDSGKATRITAQKSRSLKCQRCWNYVATVGGNEAHPDLCERCISAL